MALNDCAIPLSWRGRGLCLAEFSDLAETDPHAWVDLVWARVYSIWFSQCRWGHCDIPIYTYDFKPNSLS
jgi:hypothetical protein